MFTHRRLTVIAAIGLIAVLSLQACSSSGSSTASSGSGSASSSSSAGTSASTSSTGVTSAGKIKSIYFANPLPTYPDFQDADRCFRSETKRLGITGTTSGPTGTATDNNFTLDRISQAIAQKVSAIIMVPLTPDFTPLITQAKGQGIYVAAVNTGSTTTAQNFEVGTDWTAQGKNVATVIGERPGKQVVGLITDAPGSVGDTIIAGIKANLPSNVSIAGEAFDAGDPSKTADATENLLIAHPDINVLYAWEGTAVAGLITAIKEHGALGKTVGVVNDVTAPVIAGMREGSIYATSVPDLCGMLTQTIDSLVKVSEGQSVPATSDVGTTIVKATDLDSYLATHPQ